MTKTPYDKDFCEVNAPPEIHACQSHNYIPLEFVLTKKHYPNGYSKAPEYEYHVTAFNATCVHVTKYFCPLCKQIINAPKVYQEG